MRHWTVEGWKRLDGHNAKVSDSQGHAGSKKAPVVRRGYRSEVLAWMKRTGMENIRQAAKRLGVSVSTLKSIMSERGQQRYGPDTLDEVLKKIGYHQG
jgi:PP-loop superfamily ATP-utilizing enzyme